MTCSRSRRRATAGTATVGAVVTPLDPALFPKQPA